MTEPDFEHRTSDSVSIFLVIYFICVSTLYVPFRISSNRIWMGKQLCFEDVPLSICQFEQFYLLYCFLFGEVSQLHTHCLCSVMETVNSFIASLLTEVANSCPLPWKIVPMNLHMHFLLLLLVHFWLCTFEKKDLFLALPPFCHLQVRVFFPFQLNLLLFLRLHHILGLL